MRLRKAAETEDISKSEFIRRAIIRELARVDRKSRKKVTGNDRDNS